MPRVVYDGEDVVFEGAPPENLGALVDLLRHNAAGKGKFILSLKVDGVGVSLSEVDHLQQEYQLLEVQSGSDRELFLAAIDSTIKKMPEPDEAIDPILESLLSDGWGEAFGRLNAFLQSLAPLLELLANLTQYAQHANVPWKSDLSEHVQRVETIFTTILRQSETQKVAELTGLLNVEFRSVYAGCLGLVKGPVRASFVK